MPTAARGSHHQLALPLPQGYHHNYHKGYSFFAASRLDDLQSTEYDALNRYLDDLCAFLTNTRLIQRHPEKFFDYIRGEAWRASSTHVGGDAITRAEVAYTLERCNAFQDLFDGDETEEAGEVASAARNMASLRAYVQAGPPERDIKGRGISDSPGLAKLHEFYQATNQLMLGRRRSEDNDAASATLRPLDEIRRQAGDEVQDGSRDGTIEHRQRVLKQVLSLGMNPKKQHEVAIMHDTVADLVCCCGGAGGGAGSMGTPQSVINIGEGKGYVSRTLALCAGLQVIGIDCNPAHKERAPERVESTLSASISLRDGEKGRDMTNLFYERRGHIGSVVCRLGDTVDWASLLRGHVRTIDEGTGAVTDIDADKVDLEEDAFNSDANTILSLRGASTTAAAVNEATVREHDNAAKLQCRLCGKVVRVANPTLLLKHAHMHLRDNGSSCDSSSGSNSAPPAPPGVPTKAEANQWNLELSQQRYAEKLMAAFFHPLSAESGAPSAVVHDDGRGEAASAKRPRLTDDTDTAAVPSALSRHGLSPVHLPRGARALVVRMARHLPSDSPKGEGTGSREMPACVAEFDPHPPPPSPCSAQGPRPCYSMEEGFVTITGYDDASGRHIVVGDDSSRREPYMLWMSGEGGPPELPVVVKEAMEREDPQRRNAVVLRVLPFAETLSPAVTVPSLCDTVMMGLHTCGDLGSNVCRLFLQTESRGLLLVSCCWHALTREGFPLSAALRRRGMAVEKVSLLLATQPLDMWATTSAEGHKSSAKVLFFRSLLGVLWSRWADAYTTETATSGGGGRPVVCDHKCPFAPLPHLEPSFLRKVTKVKERLDFRSFVELVLDEYVYAATGKITGYTWHSQVCASCREEEEAFLKGAAAAAVLRDVVDAYCRPLFSSFLGLTVLRMWMCHLVESLLLLDRTLYLHEGMVAAASEQAGARGTKASSSAVSLAPLFDGAISPRLYGTLARRF